MNSEEQETLKAIKEYMKTISMDMEVIRRRLRNMGKDKYGCNNDLCIYIHKMCLTKPKCKECIDNGIK